MQRQWLLLRSNFDFVTRWNWLQKSVFSMNNVIWKPLLDPWNILLPPLLWQLGLMKLFVTVLDKESAVFKFKSWDFLGKKYLKAVDYCGKNQSLCLRRTTNKEFYRMQKILQLIFKLKKWKHSIDVTPEALATFEKTLCLVLEFLLFQKIVFKPLGTKLLCISRKVISPNKQLSY